MGAWVTQPECQKTKSGGESKRSTYWHPSSIASAKIPTGFSQQCHLNQKTWVGSIIGTKKPTSSNMNHQCSASNPDSNHILKRCVKLEAVYVDILVRGGVITGVYWDTGFMRGFWLCPSLITPLCRGPLHVSGTPQCVLVYPYVAWQGSVNSCLQPFSDKLVPYRGI